MKSLTDMDPEPRFTEIKGCPPAVVLASDFIEMCLEQQRTALVSRMDDDDDDGDCGSNEVSIMQGLRQNLEVSEMLPKQAAAFDMACNLIGRYFQAETEMIEARLSIQPRNE